MGILELSMKKETGPAVLAATARPSRLEAATIRFGTLSSIGNPGSRAIVLIFVPLPTSSRGVPGPGWMTRSALGSLGQLKHGGAAMVIGAKSRPCTSKQAQYNAGAGAQEQSCHFRGFDLDTTATSEWPRLTWPNQSTTAGLAKDRPSRAARSREVEQRQVNAAASDEQIASHSQSICCGRPFHHGRLSVIIPRPLQWQPGTSHHLQTAHIDFSVPQRTVFW